MRRVIVAASIALLGLTAGSALTAFAGEPATRPPATKPKSAPAAVAVENAVVNEAVEYRFLVLSAATAPTAEHEKQLNVLGAEGWRVVAPIYSGGILNSYLMSRARPAK